MSALVPDLALPGLHLVTVPDGAPPYDCPVHGAGCPEHRAGGAPDGGGHPAVRAAGVTGTGVAGEPGLRRPAAGAVTALALVIVEALAGVRPERQLIPLATDRVRARARGLGPLLRCEQRPRVLRIITSQPEPPVVEMTMVVAFGARSRALALRFEQADARPATAGWPGRPGRWLCTALETG